MGRLAVDSMGRIYEVSSDRADGLGDGKYPECAGQSDTTLGSVYLKAQAKRTNDLLRSKQQQAIMDQQDRMQKMSQRQILKQAMKRDEAIGRMQNHPAMKDALIKKAVSMGCACEDSPQMAGKLTANGQSGWRGMSRDQKIIHHELTGMGHNVAFLPNPQEIRQHADNKRMMDMLRIKARK